jgi:hypothetical protein
MNHYFERPIWDKTKCPDLSKLAKVKGTVHLQNVRVIKVKNATYRGTVFNGTFHLSNAVKLPIGDSGTKRVEVYCGWFGHRLKTRGLKFQIDLATAVIDDNFSGDVDNNLAN